MRYIKYVTDNPYRLLQVSSCIDAKGLRKAADKVIKTVQAGLPFETDLRQDAERCLLDGDLYGFKAIKQRALDIYWKHYVNTDECWTGLVDYLRHSRENALDGQAYHEYLKRAEDCLSRNDWEGVRVNAVQAMQYLPGGEEKQTRFYKNMLDKS